MLNELDKELMGKGLRFVRYADDFSIYCKSAYQARKVGNQVYVYLRDKLKLPINREKSGIRRPVTFTILGYGFVPTYKKGDRGKYQLVVTEKGWQSLKYKLKILTRKTSPIPLGERLQRIKEVQQGWLQYYRMASIQGKLRDVDGWVRNRLRCCIWKQWKKPERRRKNLLRLGVDSEHAYNHSRSRMGTWAVACSPILLTTITVERLQKRGYESMSTYYFKIAPFLHEPSRHHVIGMV